MNRKSSALKLIACVVGLALLGCPARRRAAHPTATAANVAKPQPCAELNPVLIGQGTTRSLEIDVTGKGPGTCRVDVEALELRQRSANGMLIVVKPMPRAAKVTVNTGETRRVTRSFRVPLASAPCGFALRGKLRFTTASGDVLDSPFDVGPKCAPKAEIAE